MSTDETPQANTDEALMRAYARGDARAFEALYDRHERALWRFVLRSVQDAALADDIAQEIWLSIARSAERYEATAKFRTWAFTMARNRIIDHTRTRKNNFSIDEETDDGEPIFEALAADSKLGPIRQLESKQTAQQLIDAIEMLPADQREAFLLQAEAEMSIEEIAATTQVSFETAKSRLRYARNKLRSVLSGNPSMASMAEART